MRTGRLRTGLVAEVLAYVSENSVRLALAAVSGVLVARHLGPADLGLLSFVHAVFGLIASLATLGLQQVLVREFSTRPAWRELAASALVHQLPVALVGSVTGFGIVVLARSGDPDAVMVALALAPLPLLALEQTPRAFLESGGRAKRILVTGITASTVSATVKVAGVVGDAPVWFFAAAATIELTIVLLGLLAGLPARWSVRALRRNASRTVGRALVREATPLLLASVATTIYMRADLLMLGALSDDTETGLYAAAARISEVCYFVPVAIAAAVRPRLARLYVAGDPQRYEAATQRFMTALAAASLVAVAGTLLTADLVVRLLYGAAFADAANVLRIHILASPFVFLGVASTQWLIDRRMSRVILVRSVAGAVLNIVVNLALIPSLGAVGASVATLISYAASGVVVHAFTGPTRPLFLLQLRSFLFARPRASVGSDEP